MEEIIDRKREKVEVDTMSPLTWAYVGDSVYELFIRNHLVNTTKNETTYVTYKIDTICKGRSSKLRY